MTNDVIIQTGKDFRVVEITATHKTLPKGNYILRFHEMRGYYLERSADFILPKKIYGDISYVNRWKKAYEESSKNIGILLSGYKGNGKTLTAQYFCQMMGLPVIFITEPYQGPDFESFITSPVLNNSIIFIDEYEKIYRGNDENALLALMDGVYTTHNIFLLTVNDSRSISDKLKNRLGRIRYHKQSSLIADSVVDDAINDLLIHKQHAASIKLVLEMIPTVSFDILTTIIKEINMFNESALECVKHLNIVRETAYYSIMATDGVIKRECDCQHVILPDGSFRLFYNKRLNDKKETWPEGMIYLKDYTVEKIMGGVKFTLKDKYEITLVRYEIDQFTF